MDWYGLKSIDINKNNTDFDIILKFNEKTDIDDHNDFKTYNFIDA